MRKIKITFMQVLTATKSSIEFRQTFTKELIPLQLNTSSPVSTWVRFASACIYSEEKS